MVERGPTPKEDPFPRRIEPMLSILAIREPPNSKDWISEFNWEGLRVIAYVQKKQGVKILTRQRDNVTENFWELSGGLLMLSKSHSMAIDAQIVCAGNNNENSKKKVQMRAKTDPRIQKIGPANECYLIATDIIYLDGKNLENMPLLERKKFLQEAIPGKIQSKFNLRVNEFTETDHRNFRRNAKAFGFSSIAMRRKESRYKQGKRSKDWLRISLARKRRRPEPKNHPKK